MSDKQQSLSRIRDNYEKIRNGMDINDLNDIISDSSDELFAGLKEIVFSKKNTINIQNDIRRIARSLEDKAKNTKNEMIKITKERTDIEQIITDKGNEKSSKETEKTKNETRIQDINTDITTKKTEIVKLNDEKNTKIEEKRNLKDNSIDETEAIKENEEKMKENTEELNSIKTKLTEAEKNIEKFKDELMEIEADIKILEKNDTNNKNKLSKTNSEITKKESIITQIKQEIEDKANKITTERIQSIGDNKPSKSYEDIEKRYPDIYNEYKGNGNTEESLKKLDKKLAEKIINKGSELKENIDTKDGLEREKKDLDNKIQNEENEKIKLEQKKQNITTKKTKLEGETTLLKSKKNNLETEGIKIKNEKETIKQNKKNDSIEKKSTKIDYDISDIEKKVKDIENEITKLENEQNSLKSKNETNIREIKNIETEIKETENKLKEKEEKEKLTQENLTSFKNAIDAHKEIAERSDLFDTDKDLQEQKIKQNTTSNASIIAGFLRDINNKPDPLEFEIYDGENKKVTGNKIKNIKLKDGKIVNIEGITINNNGEIAWDKAKVSDAATDKAIDDFPIEFELEIGAKTIISGSLQQNTPKRDITITNKKMLQIKIDVDHLDQDKRKNEVNAYNNSGTGGRIEKSLDANHDVLIARLEREAFYRGLEKADGPKFNKLNAEQKELLYQDVRNTYRTAAGNPRTGAQFGRAANLANMNNFNIGDTSFLEWITGEKHESNKPEFTKHGEAYRAYIHNNLEDQIKKYFERRFDQVFSNNQDGNTYIKGELTDFLTDIEKQKLDNDEVHQDVLRDIDAVDEMENTRRFGRLGRKDVNYLRFFAGQDSKVDIKDQTVNITTNNRPEDLNNPEPVKYDMNMEVSGKQQILVNIKIDKQKEIKLKAGDPAAMVRTILQCEAIQHGKVRAHVVYNVIKGFIKSAKQKDISLTYRDPGTGDMMMIRMDGNNIVLEQQDNQSNFGGTFRRNTTVLFDHQYFENTNTFDSTRGNENRRLRVGIDRMMGHFNFAMNELHYQYRQASEKRWMGLRRGDTRMTLPTSFWLSPIKKIINLGTTTKFDFSTNAQANGKSVNIEFKNNKFTLNMAGLKKPISSRTLGKLLRYRQGGIRIFDGMERDICGKVYEEMIKKMRENSKIAKTNFGVKDNITGRTYILDSDGQLGYVSAEQASTQQNMIRRGAMSHREYGIVNNPPAGRTMCDESETREVMKNPFLMGRLIKTMNNRMGIVSSTRSLVN